MSMTTEVSGLTLQAVPGCPKGAAAAVGPVLSLLMLVTAAVGRTSPGHRSDTRQYPRFAKNRLICYKSVRLVSPVTL
jgi:hypothetical protein